MNALSVLGSLIILILNIWAILSVFRSNTTVAVKVLWILLIVILPVIGLVIWAIAGPRDNKPAGPDYQR